MNQAGDSGFSQRTVLALSLFGIAVFVALLWMIGSGAAESEPQPSGAHVSGKGLSGYAALAGYLERRGFEVSRARTRGALKQRGVLVLTPLHSGGVDDIAAVVNDHRMAGPTIVVLPKWIALEAPENVAKGRKGWVILADARPPMWPGFHDEIVLNLQAEQDSAWYGGPVDGELPDDKAVLSATIGKVPGKDDAWPHVPLVKADSGRMLASYVHDGNDYPGLRNIALEDEPQFEEEVEGDGSYPLIFIYEPDLINNYGLARQENAWLAERLVMAALDGDERKVTFDLTLAGPGRSENLLTLAFTAPFLAATVCLLLAAAVLMWRAMNRFGPPLAPARELAFGKHVLVANAAGLVRRAGRLHLIGGPYADASRERLARALALPARLDPEALEAAIDRALAARRPQAEPYSAAAAAMRAARRPIDLLRAAQTLHSLERILTR
ncbi:MAG TPA: DUF4350 domain-containing protein [Novosphingobium sp.]|nr:DUF4350 domain-containing protein [Novosphingobium sp.]